MRKATPLVLTRPEVFHGFGPVVVWAGGEPFYTFTGDRFAFTLPRGRYMVQGDFRPQGALLVQMPTMPPPPLPMPSRLVVRWCDNPSTCSIDLIRGRIYADHGLKGLPRFARRYVFLHERGHYWNHGATGAEAMDRQERACDAYAAARMLAEGYNPSQIAIASRLTLSDCSADRRSDMWNKMKNAQ